MVFTVTPLIIYVYLTFLWKSQVYWVGLDILISIQSSFQLSVESSQAISLVLVFQYSVEDRFRMNIW